MGQPSAADLLAAWETGLARPPVDRAPQLLRLSDEDADVDEMPVGECDGRLLDLRIAWFGAQIEAVSACRHCAQEVDVSFDLRDLDTTAPPSRVVEVADGGYQIECRLPTNADLRWLAGRGDAAGEVDLLERCVVTAHSPDGPVEAREIPGGVVESIASVLARCDPASETSMTITCPACGSTWAERFDIREFLWSEVTDWAYGLLDDVHRLALAYGWRESDVLALTAQRRQFYLGANGW